MNASPKMALFSESSCLHARDELNSWISAPAIPLAQPQPQFSSKQNSQVLSLSLQLPTSVASIPRSNALPNTTASRTPVLAKGSCSAIEHTGRTDFTTVSRGKLMFSENSQKLKAVAAANGGVGVGGVSASAWSLKERASSSCSW